MPPPEPHHARRTVRGDRPHDDDRGPDCLAWLLTDFLRLDLRTLTPAAFECWLSLAADCLWHLYRSEVGHAGSLHARTWFRLVAESIGRQFPDYPGGQEQVPLDLACLMIQQQWRP